MHQIASRINPSRILTISSTTNRRFLNFNKIENKCFVEKLPENEINGIENAI